jgi:hypothetical protein
VVRRRMGRAGVLVGVVMLGTVAASGGPALAQGASASPGATGQERVVSLGAVDELFRDDFSTTANWGVYDAEAASVDGENGGLRFRLRTDSQNRWNWHTLETSTPVMRFGITAAFEPGAGAAGPMCGSVGDAPSFFGGVVNTGGEWVLVRIVGNELTVIDRGAVPGLDLSEGGTPRLEIECAVTGGAGDRVAFFVDGVNVADAVDASSFGPFDKAGLYADVAKGPFQVIFDDAVILGGATYDPQTEPGPGPVVTPAPVGTQFPDVTPAPVGTPVPDVTPAPAVTAAPTPAPSAGPVGGTLVTLGATRLALQEPFDDETVWGVTKGDQGSIAYDAGTLRVTLRPENHSLWSWLPFEQGVPVLGVDTSVSLDAGQGKAGPMCGSAEGAPRFYYAAVSPAGRLTLGTIVAGVVDEVDRFVTGPVAAGTAVRVRIECAVTGSGTDRVAAWVNERLVADVTMSTGFGPFSKAAVMASNETRRWSAAFDDLVVRTGDYAPAGDGPVTSPVPTTPPQPSVAPSTPLPVGALLGAVPEAFRADCRAVPADAATGQLEAILCAPAGSAASAEYYRYATPEDLQTAFDTLVPVSAGDLSGTDCIAAPGLVSYTIGGQDAGVLACYPAARGRGVTFQWTNKDLLVLAFGTHASGSYADAFAWWQDAGPQP